MDQVVTFGTRVCEHNTHCSCGGLPTNDARALNWDGDANEAQIRTIGFTSKCKADASVREGGVVAAVPGFTAGSRIDVDRPL